MAVRRTTSATKSSAGAKPKPGSKPQPIVASTDFAGFPSAGASFFKELAAHQDRDWFTANKARYETLWVRPMEALLESVVARLSAAFPRMKDSHRKIFRIHRDVRFSNDKTPYKTNISAVVPLRPVPRGSETESGLYIQLGSDSMLAIGQWMLEKEALLEYRAAVADAKTGPRLQKLVDAARAEGFKLMSHEPLKRVPPPFGQDHPRAELLKQKGLALAFPPIPRGILGKPEFAAWIADRARSVQPIARWLEAALD